MRGHQKRGDYNPFTTRPDDPSSDFIALCPGGATRLTTQQEANDQALEGRPPTDRDGVRAQ